MRSVFRSGRHIEIQAIDDTKGHNSKWQYYARYVNNRTNYNISRCGSIDEVYNKANIERPKKELTYKWEISCRKCGAVWLKTRITNRVLASYKRNGRICTKIIR